VKRLSTRKKNGSKRAAQTVGQGSANELALDYRHRIGFVFILAIDGSDRFPRDLKKKLHRGAATLFWWMVAIFVIGGVIGLLNFGWKHL